MVKEGEHVRIAKLSEDEGKEVAFDVVLYAKDKGMKVGTPYLEDVEVKGKIAKNGKGEKLIVYKYKKRKRQSLKRGHRQDYTEVEITSIGPKEVATPPAKKVAAKAMIATRKTVKK